MKELIDQSGLEPVYYTPKAGSVLIWHENLAHGGSPPQQRRIDSQIDRQPLLRPRRRRLLRQPGHACLDDSSGRRLKGMPARLDSQGFTPRTIARMQSIRTDPSEAGGECRNVRMLGPASSLSRTDSLVSHGVPRSNHSSKSRTNGSSIKLIFSSPLRANRSTSSPPVRLRVWVRSRAISSAL